MLLALTAPIVHAAAENKSGRYLDLLGTDAVAHLQGVEYLSESERGHMAEYLAGAGPELSMRLQDVTARLGCKNGPVAADQQGYLRQILTEIYAAHVRQAMHRFELLYGEQAERLLREIPASDSDMGHLVQTNLTACGGAVELQTAASE